MVNLAVLACVLIVATPVGAWLGDTLISIDPLEKADYIVVLGGAHERGVEAANLYRRGYAPKVIVSSTRDGVDVLADVVAAYGVPRDDILIDGKTTRTASHPETVARIPQVDVKSDRFIVLTSPYHTSRSRACFLKYGYKNVCMRSPGWRVGGKYGRGGWARRSMALYEMVYEVLAWGMYTVFGWV